MKIKSLIAFAIARAAFVAAVSLIVALPASAATVTPSPELVVNGDFEAGTVATDAYHGPWSDTSAYLPKWNIYLCGKSTASGTFVAEGIDIGKHAIFTKTEADSSKYNSYFYQDVTVPEAGTYRLYFEYGGRADKQKFRNHTITVYLSEVVDGEVETEKAIVSNLNNSSAAKQSQAVFVDLTPGTWRLKFNTAASQDSSTWFDHISLRRVETVLTNGGFDQYTITANSGEYIYSHEAGFSCPGWSFTLGGLTKNNTTWVANIGTGVNAIFIQSYKGNPESSAWQDVTITKPGIYTLSFKYAARPSKTGQNVKVLFGKQDEEDIVDTFTSTDTSWNECSLRVAALFPGTYRLKITGSSSDDRGTIFDNFRLWIDDEMVENGDFEAGEAGDKEWGSYMNKCTNPGWTVSSTVQVGIGNPFGTWIASGLDIGKYAMYIQNSGGVDNVKAWQDIHVSVPGRYTLKHNYTARPGHTGQSFTTQLGAVLGDDIDNGNVPSSEEWTVTDAASLAAYEKTGIGIASAGDYRLRFVGKTTGTKDVATAVDCVSLKREPNYVFWTGGGDGETMSDPANWGVESISYADDFVFTNDTPLAVNLTVDFAGATINFLGTGSVTLNGIVDDGETVATNTLSVAQIYSAPSAAAALFNCPVEFVDGYDVVSTATNTFALGATATGWTYAQGAGAHVLDGDFEFTGDTLALSGDVTLAAGRTLRAAGLTGVDDATLTIGDNAKAVLSGDIATASGAAALLEIYLADTAELWATNSTALASQHFFTASRRTGTVNIGGVVLNTAYHGVGLYAGRMNIGSGGVTDNGTANGLYIDVSGTGNGGASMTYGAFADWTWTGKGSGTISLSKNHFTFDTLDCFDGATERVITLAAATTANDTSTVRKTNPGTLVLAASNYFGGGLYVDGGVVRVAADQGSGTGPATVASGATLEVASGGVLRNSSVTVADGGTLALADGGTLVSPVSAEGEVRVSGAATLTAGGSIAFSGAGAFSFEEGAAITVGSDVEEGATLVTGAGLTAQDLAAHFVTPFGAVSLDNSGNVVYTSAIEWISGASGADDGIYLGFAGGHAANMLQTAALAEEDLARYTEKNPPGNAAGVSPNTVLADGDVHTPLEAVDYSRVYSLNKGTYTFTFASPTNIGEVAIFTRWGNGGRDGIKISKVLVRTEGSDEWKEISAGAFSTGLSDNDSSTGAMVAVLKRKDGLLLASGVTALKFVFPSGQDNNGTGFTELAAFDRCIPVAKVWTWNGSAGNTLFSDAGNWEDASGNAAGAAGEAFSTACSDTIKIPAGVQVTMDVSADVAMAELGGGVTFANPAPDAVTGAVATNVLACAYISNAAGEETRFDCAVGFTGKYYVHADGLVRFAGGATATAMGEAGGAYMRTLAGDITLSGDFDVINEETEYWCVTNASRFTAGVLKKNSTAGNVNGTPNFRVCEGGYAHFTSITSGRDRLAVSVQGELEVDDWYDTMSVKVVKSGLTYAGDIGYPGDEAFSGSTVRAGGIRRTRYSTNSSYKDYMTCFYPANYYIGSLGIGLTYRDHTLMFTGCEKHIYATADFSIFNYTGETPDNLADWGVYIAADTMLDTQGHTVTWNAGAVINMSSTFTKAGEGTLVMEPRGATYEGSGNAVVVAGGTLEARACTLSGAATWSSVFGGVPVTVKGGAVLRIASGVTSVTNAVTLEEGATLDIQSFTSRSAEAASVGALSATGPATVRLSGTLPDSVFSTGTNFVIAASCDAASLANISLDKSGLVFENAGNCSNARLDVVDGKLVVSVKPYFYIKVR